MGALQTRGERRTAEDDGAKASTLCEWARKRRQE
jgi:hypothetical protein